MADNNKLFVTTRESRSIHIITPDEVLEPINALEGVWARRVGIEDAPFRQDEETPRAETQVWSEEKEEVVADPKTDKPTPTPTKPPSKPKDSIIPTGTPARNDSVRDKQSPD